MLGLPRVPNFVVTALYDIAYRLAEGSGSGVRRFSALTPWLRITLLTTALKYLGLKTG